MRLGLCLTLLLLAFFAPRDARAWWNNDWEFRKKIVINKGPSGVPAGTEVAQYPILLRLDVGNFSFIDTLESGADLRVVSSDDKTLLPFHIERYDWINEVGYLWVQVPSLGNADAPPYIWIYFGNSAAKAASDSKATFDSNQTLVFHFAEKEALPQDASSFANHSSQSTAAAVPNGQIDAAVRYDGTMFTLVPASPSLKVSAKSGFSFSAWIKPEGLQSATLFRQQDQGRSLTIALDNGRPVAIVAGDAGKTFATQPQARLAPDEWHHLAVTASDRLAVYVDGVEVSSAAAELTDLGGDITIGGMPGTNNGFKGLLDEVRLAKEARTADWFKLAVISQQPDSKLLTFGEDEHAHTGGDYLAMIALLVGSVSLDGWIVIGLIGLLGFISGEVAIGKTLMLRRAVRANDRFLESFRSKGADPLDLANHDGLSAGKSTNWNDSPLFVVYRAGIEELGRLHEAQGESERFNNLSLEVVRAAVDTSLIKEANRISDKMVLLTLAVSGAPFLGLLGTVVGIMITFASIALKGDVNINTIAPGIAAAITATAAGMLVAIPALFAYNVLMVWIKDVLTVMETFRDEFLSKIAVKFA